MTRRFWSWLVVALVVLIGGVVGGLRWLRPPPDRELQRLLAQLPRSATDPHFPVQVLEVWTPDCASCAAQIPAFNKMQASYGRQAEFLALTAAPEDQVTDLLKLRAETIAFSVLPDQPALVGYLLARSPVPHPRLPVLVVVRRGRIAAYASGPQATATWLASALQREL